MLTFFTIYHCLDEEFLQKTSKVNWQDILSYIEVIYIYDDYCLLYLLKLENINNLKNLFIKIQPFFQNKLENDENFKKELFVHIKCRIASLFQCLKNDKLCRKPPSILRYKK